MSKRSRKGGSRGRGPPHGFRVEGLQQTRRRDLAVAYLIGGDMFLAAGKGTKAAACWRLAIEKAKAGSPVVKAAQEPLQKLKAKAAVKQDAANLPAEAPVARQEPEKR